MVDRIGEGSSLARSAIEAALARQSAALQRMQDAAARVGSASAAAGGAAPGAAAPTDFRRSLVGGLAEVDAQVRQSDRLIDDVVAGRAADFHEIAAQLKQSELSFKFALEVRNKLIDAYREVMRMGV